MNIFEEYGRLHWVIYFRVLITLKIAPGSWSKVFLGWNQSPSK